MSVTRRQFSKMIFGAAALSMIDIETYARILEPKNSMRRLATQTASGEGVWTNLKVEGKIPKSLNGNLFRTAPGESERFGVIFNHLFDGDAYVSGWNFDEGKVSLRAQYIATKERLAELKAKKAMYSEFGTKVPGARGSKNQPSVNIVDWRGKLLGLSEGSTPTIINPKTFAFEGYESFDGVVPDYLTFTAHPRFDPVSGDMFAFGFERRPPGRMHIIQVSKATGKAKNLYKAPQNGFNMVHDAMLTENYFVILVPPMSYDVSKMMKGTPPGQAVRFLEKQSTMLYAFPRNNKNGKAKPISVKLPPYFIFHYGNAFEIDESKLKFEVVASKTGSAFEFLKNWRTDKEVKYEKPRLKAMTIDLKNRKVDATVDLAEDVEFPRYDMRRTGKESRYLYVADKLYGENAAVIKVDLKKGRSIKRSVGKGKTLAEPVFVPNGSNSEDDGWILSLGYDGRRNENFLEILNAENLDRAARVWAAGQHFPLGFHGNFVSNT